MPFPIGRFLTVLTLLVSAATTAVANESLGISKISAYNGTWTSRIVRYDTAPGKPHVETAAVRNECRRSGDFYMCHQFVDGKSAALIIYTYDPKRRVYYTHVIVPGGAPAPGGVLEVDGNTWTYPWEEKDQSGKTVHVRIVNTFRDANTIGFHQESSPDNIHWMRTADGVEHRRKA